MLNLTIRLGTPHDFERLDAIRGAAFAPVISSFRSLVGPAIASVAFRDAEREQRDHLRGLLDPGDGQAVLVALHDGVACGFCAFTWKAETKIGEIGLNAVHPSSQRQGVGRRLYAAALDRMRVEGMRVATVGTGADDSHAPARAALATVEFGAAVPSVYLYRML